MNPKKPTSIIVNIITGALFVGVAALGYLTFFHNTSPENPNVATPSSTPEAGTPDLVRTSLDIAKTAKDLGELSKSVDSATEIINSKPFQSLTDFSVPVPSEAIGREYPFSKTDWRLKAEAAEKLAEQRTIAAQTAAARAPASVASVATTTATSTVPSFTSGTTASSTTTTTDIKTL